MKLVVVGGAPYASEYITRVRRAADPRVLFPGYIFGPGYWELQRNAYLFCAPTEVGGTHPVILEALAAGNCVLVNDYRPNAETVGDAGVYFSGSEGVPDLARQLERLLSEPELVEDYRSRALERAELYSWDAVASAYEELLLEVGGGSALDRHGDRARAAALPGQPVGARGPRAQLHEHVVAEAAGGHAADLLPGRGAARAGTRPPPAARSAGGAGRLAPNTRDPPALA